MERPERIVLLIIGALSNRMEAVLWVLAVLGNWTVIDRIYYTWKELPKSKESNWIAFCKNACRQLEPLLLTPAGSFCSNFESEFWDLSSHPKTLPEDNRTRFLEFLLNRNSRRFLNPPDNRSDKAAILGFLGFSLNTAQGAPSTDSSP